MTARNSSGAGHATSAPTSIVPASGCPPGTGTIQIAQVAPPARLAITSAAVSPPVTRATHDAPIHLQVTACSGRPVQGATVYAAPIPYNQFAGAAVKTASNGKVTIKETRQNGFPAGRHQRLLAVFVRA